MHGANCYIFSGDTLKISTNLVIPKSINDVNVKPGSISTNFCPTIDMTLHKLSSITDPFATFLIPAAIKFKNLQNSDVGFFISGSIIWSDFSSIYFNVFIVKSSGYSFILSIKAITISSLVTNCFKKSAPLIDDN